MLGLEALKRRVYCDWLGWHRGHVETYDGWTFLECHRCGRLAHPVPPETSIRLAREEGYDDVADLFEDRWK